MLKSKLLSKVSPYLAPTCLHHYLRLRRDYRPHHQGLLTSQQLAGKCWMLQLDGKCGTLLQQKIHFANCESYSGVIIISLVGKYAVNTVNTIQGQNLFEEIQQMRQVMH